MTNPIYLDYQATTPVDTRVAEKILYYMTIAFGNASSVDHLYGEEADQAILSAKKSVAELVGALPKEIIFTSGATESINLGIQGHVLASSKCTNIAVTGIEHKAVLDTCNAMAKKGLAKITSIPVDSLGRIDLERLDNICRQGIDLLCVMMANNEIGNIYPIADIGAIAQKYNISFFCDASQAVGKVPIHCQDWNISYMAISAHKFYGPKGVGALIVKKGKKLSPVMFGGGQQNALRSGTLNVPGIVGLGEACRLRSLEMDIDERAIAILRDKLQNELLEQIDRLVINGDPTNRLTGNLHISIPDIPNSAIVARVRHKLAISTGAACASGVESPSHVLRALNLSKNIIDGALRISLGKFTTKKEIEEAINIIVKTVRDIRYLM